MEDSKDSKQEGNSFKRKRDATPEGGTEKDRTPSPTPSPTTSKKRRSSSSTPEGGSEKDNGDKTPTKEHIIIPDSPPSRCLPFPCCRSVDNYKRLNRVQEGAYGVVHRAKDKETGEIVALKKFKLQASDSFPVTSLREITVLMQCQHENIVRLKEVVVGKDAHNSFYMVMEFLEHDLKDLMTAMRDPFLSSEIKCLMLQFLEAMDYLHSNWFLHRDLKTSNLLLSKKGILKVADFGLARHFGEPLKPYTQPVVTLWYRAPELLLGAKEYSWAVDMWAVGCIFGEMLTKDPLFKGRSEIDQIDVMFKLLGTPDETIWPGYSELPYPKKMNFRRYPPTLRKKIGSGTTDAGWDLLMRMLAWDPAKRITAREAINHRYFKEYPLPREPGLIQTFPSLHEGKKVPKVSNAEHIFTAPALASTEEAEQFGVDPYGTQPSGFKLKF